METSRKRVAANQKGFTLIEFLIALVVIGFIVTLLVNFFSNPLKDASLNKATTKITDDLRVFADAEQKYYADHTADIAALTDLYTGASPVMTSLPVAPANGADANPPDGTYVYTLDTASYTAWGNPANADMVVKLPKVSKAVCDKINTDAGVTLAAAPVASAGLQCIGAPGGPYTVVKPISID